MSSNMSERRRPPPPPPPELEEPELSPPELPPELDDVEYFVDVLELSWVLTSVPKPAQSSQTSSSAPSTLTVFGDDTSAPHISHCTI
ncbi:hypothetical protein GCM10009020_26570 [Natronoarchaeum mannanilyticum]|uniref:Uncharacterized protein n=1 Tax=Natronoarchaeum mannanilyticum TaxID=926360 RepID=A0AAV3TBD4_9EURY